MIGTIRKRPRPKAHKFYPVLSRSHKGRESCDYCDSCMAEFAEQAESERPGHVWTVVEGKVVFMEDTIAQSILGRPLNEKEAAIHKDQNPLNNTRAMRDGIVCGLCHRYVYLGGCVTKDCTSCVKLYRQLEQESEKEKP